MRKSVPAERLAHASASGYRFRFDSATTSSRAALARMRSS
jgi:hypothetical protein